MLNAAEFPRCSKVDEYGLELTGVTWHDGGIYGCQFLTEGERSANTVIVIGQLVC